MKNELAKKIKNLPQNAGVYLFKGGKENILYIGKAKNIKRRVNSHFFAKKSWFWDFMPAIEDIDYFECKNEKEAMILEAQLIKKCQPKYNIEWKDDKNYFFVGITKEVFPRVFWTHQIKIKAKGKAGKTMEFLGPFVNGGDLKNFLKEARKIFPYRSCKILPKKSCLYYHLNLCSAPCIRKIQKSKYNKMIKALKVLLEIYEGRNRRIEGYDVSNLSGSLATGSMIVFEGQRKKRSDYRKFKIKRVRGQNDIKSLREMILRRIKHKEWKTPDLILIDGGKGQLGIAKDLPIPSLSLAKKEKTSGKIFSLFSKNFVLLDEFPLDIRNLFLQIRDEAHRFAISYQKKRRINYFLRQKNK